MITFLSGFFILTTVNHNLTLYLHSALRLVNFFINLLLNNWILNLGVLRNIIQNIISTY